MQSDNMEVNRDSKILICGLHYSSQCTIRTRDKKFKVLYSLANRSNNWYGSWARHRWWAQAVAYVLENMHQPGGRQVRDNQC